VKNFKDKERSDESMMVFGYGDGGGGPLMNMVENLNRMKDVDGLPKIEMELLSIFLTGLLLTLKTSLLGLANWYVLLFSLIFYTIVLLELFFRCFFVVIFAIASL
jgi:alpha-mannosidase